MFRSRPSSPNTIWYSCSRSASGYPPVALAIHTRLVPHPSNGSPAYQGLGVMVTVSADASCAGVAALAGVAVPPVATSAPAATSAAQPVAAAAGRQGMDNFIVLPFVLGDQNFRRRRTSKSGGCSGTTPATFGWSTVTVAAHGGSVVGRGGAPLRTGGESGGRVCGSE